MLLLLSLALAADPDLPHVSVHARTTVPSDVGLGAVVELPARVRVKVGAGILPGPYVDLINAVVVALGGYDEDQAQVIEDTLKSSFVLHTEVGWRPFPKLGFTVDAGYGLITLGGSTTGPELLAAAGVRPPADLGGREYEAHSTVHQVQVDVGWTFTVARHLEIVPGLGAGFTVGAHSTVRPAFDPLFPQPYEAAGDEAAAWLDETYRKYVHYPSISLAVGYRFDVGRRSAVGEP